MLSELAPKEPAARNSHHVVSVETPTLPKRRAGLCVVFCALCWVCSTLALTAAALAAGRSVWSGDSPTAASLLRGAHADGEPCSLRVFATDCRATKLQVHVSLGVLLEGLVSEESISVSGEGEEFQVRIARCSKALSDALVTEAVVAAWKGKLALLKSCGLFVANARPAGDSGERVARTAEAETRSGPSHPPPAVPEWRRHAGVLREEGGVRAHMRSFRGFTGKIMAVDTPMRLEQATAAPVYRPRTLPDFTAADRKSRGSEAGLVDVATRRACGGGCPSFQSDGLRFVGAPEPKGDQARV